MATYKLMPEPKVFYVAKDGNDNIPISGTQIDNSLATPFATIGRALEYITEKGDNDTYPYVIIVGPGTYSEIIDFAAADGLNDSIYQVTIKGAGKNLTILDGGFSAADGDNLSYFSLENLSIKGDFSLCGVNGTETFLSDGFILKDVGSAESDGTFKVGAAGMFVVAGDTSLDGYALDIENVSETRFDASTEVACESLTLTHDKDDGDAIPIPDSQTSISMDVIGTYLNPSAESSGYQVWGFSAEKSASDATGLADDATAYTASVAVDGTPNAVSVVGSAAQTITDLITEINADLSGAVAAFDDENDAIKITSSSTGAASTIAITDTDLFGTLTDANPAAETAVDGTSTFVMVEGSTGPDITVNIYNGVIDAVVTITANATLNNYAGAVTGTVTATGTHNNYGGYPTP